jgi:two-component system nitrate/nitrite response regulator NarL
MSTSATRVVLADDEVLMREGLAGLLEQAGFEVVGQSGDASELIELVRELRPDVVLVDIRLGDESGFDLARRLSGTVILISTDAQSEYAEEIAASPAAGFIRKAQLSASAVLGLAGGPVD